MASINKVILIGNLGRSVSREALSGEALRIYDAYYAALADLGSRFGSALPSDAISFQEASRRLNVALQAFKAALLPLQRIASRLWFARFGPVARAAGFFHAGKVDGRNLP
jgi:hypothetical protein